MRVNGERDPVGFMSVLNMRQHQAAEPISQIREHVLAKCPKQGKVRSAFEKALTLAPAAKLQGGSLASATGLLLSERFFNLPAQIAPWLNKGVFDEVAWATEDEKTERQRESYKFKQYLILAKVLRGPVEAEGGEADGGEGQGSSGGKRKKKKRKSGGGGGGADGEREWTYTKLEDEVFHAACGANWFTYRRDPPSLPPPSSASLDLLILHIVLIDLAQALTDYLLWLQAGADNDGADRRAAGDAAPR